MKKVLLFCMAIASLLACKRVQEEVPVSSISISPVTAQLVLGETVQLKATVFPSNATDKSIDWFSTDASVATVTDAGLVTAVKEGTSIIRATAGRITVSCTVAVSKPLVTVTSITLSPSSLELYEGEDQTLTATVLPSDATDKTVEWSTSDPEIAWVSDGTVTAVKQGEAVITAKAGEKTASCTVKVLRRAVEVESVTLSRIELQMTVGQKETLTAKVKPDNAADKGVTWSSSAPSVAKVEGGVVTALKEGEATITAKAGGKTATCTVTVVEKIVAVESVELDKTLLELMEGDTETLAATVTPDDATDKTVTWITSDASVATVDEGKVTALKEGKAYITARAGDQRAVCEVIVSKPEVKVASVTLNKTELALHKGETAVLTATVKPDDASDKTVSWQSSNEAVATVDKAGKVSALKSGTATITARAGDVTASCSVTVTTPVAGITISKTYLALEEGQSAELTATITPDDADEKTAAWSSSDNKVVTVDENGKVTAVAVGKATVTATAGGFSASCSVTVAEKVVPVESVELDKTSLALEKGQSEKLTATVKPDDATEQTVVWTTSNKKVATVDQEGNVYAVDGGSATITATCGEKTATCEVTVTVPAPPSGTGGNEGTSDESWD